jgi:predicted RNA-binding protein with PUA-like domain
MPKPKQYWMVKQEPTAYSWEQFVKDGKTSWTGVRNYQARNNLREMQVGDQVLFYHSVVGKEVVGIAKVSRTAYPDPTAEDPAWVCVDLIPETTLRCPVRLEMIKSTPGLREMSLLRNSRLSVLKVQPAEFTTILDLAS